MAAPNQCWIPRNFGIFNALLAKFWKASSLLWKIGHKCCVLYFSNIREQILFSPQEKGQWIAKNLASLFNMLWNTLNTVWLNLVVNGQLRRQDFQRDARKPNGYQSLLTVASGCGSPWMVTKFKILIWIVGFLVRYERILLGGQRKRTRAISAQIRAANDATRQQSRCSLIRSRSILSYRCCNKALSRILECILSLHCLSLHNQLFA